MFYDVLEVLEDGVKVFCNNLPALISSQQMQLLCIACVVLSNYFSNKESSASSEPPGLYERIERNVRVPTTVISAFSSLTNPLLRSLAGYKEKQRTHVTALKAVLSMQD